jgi:large subunit ribosomal protein L18
LVLTSSGKYVTAQMVHFQKGPVIEASTKEWALKKQLFQTSDYCAYTNLAKVFAQRCLESGFIEMSCDLSPKEGGKAEAFLKAVKENGVILEEPERIWPQVTVNHYIGRKEKPHGEWEA